MYNLMRNPLIYLNKLSNVIKIYVWFYCGNFTVGDTKENNTHRIACERGAQHLQYFMDGYGRAPPPPHLHMFALYINIEQSAVSIHDYIYTYFIIYILSQEYIYIKRVYSACVRFSRINARARLSFMDVVFKHTAVYVCVGSFFFWFVRDERKTTQKRCMCIQLCHHTIF